MISAQSAVNVAHTLRRIIDLCSAESGTGVRNMSLLTEQNGNQILEWNKSISGKMDSCVHDMVLQHASTTPALEAVCSWDGNLTFKELDEQSSSLAYHLTGHGIGLETFVPICFEKSMCAIVAMMAILRAGGAFVPLDPSHPKDRLLSIIRTCGASVLVTSSDCAHLFEGSGFLPLIVSQNVLNSLNSPSDSFPSPSRPGNAAFVLVTSGSTGRPKLIVQEHGSVCTSSYAHAKAMYVTSQSRVLQYAAYTFDVSMMDIFTTLLVGGCVCILSEYERMNEIPDALKRMRVNWAHITPSLASVFAPSDFPTLETLSLGGETVTPDLVSCWASKVRLLNCYGPAECAACLVGCLSQEDSMVVPLGKTFGSAGCWLVDPRDDRKLSPIGAVSELLVQAPTLARGYFNDPEKTAASFIETSLWLREDLICIKRRAYKTGDLVRYLSDGRIVFIGRKDHQLKIRGQRVELNEIEHHLLKHPLVARCAVSYPKSGIYSKNLVGVVQLCKLFATSETSYAEIKIIPRNQLETIEFNHSELSAHLKKTLPDYMIPRIWLIVEKIPLSSSVKVDRMGITDWLTKLDHASSYLNLSSHLNVSEDIYAQEISAIVADIASRGNSDFSAALEGRNIILDDVGIDSIQAISLLRSINTKFNIKLDIGFLTHPGLSVEDISSCIKSFRAGDRESSFQTRIDLMAEFHTIQRNLTVAYDRIERSQNVLLTGGTGFLGSQILFKLLTCPNFRKVIVHVRADSVALGLQRVMHSATMAKWWSDAFLDHLEIWLGDLAKPMIGLTADQWNLITGKEWKTDRISTIIHNGAAVFWNYDYQTLKAVNVCSTAELLRAAAESTYALKFVYVSGGQVPNPGNDTDEQTATELKLSTGYSQTKFVSELLVKDFAQRTNQGWHQTSIVKPGYIIGTLVEGIASTNDFVWRLVGSCLDIGGYNESEPNHWIYMSDAGRVSDIILQSSIDSSSDLKIVKIFDGLTVGEFWEVLRGDCGYNLRPMSQESWINAMQNNIEIKREKHLLWPLLHVFETNHGKLGSPQKPDHINTRDITRVKASIRKNIEHLRGIGFLPSLDDKRSIIPLKMPRSEFHKGEEGEAIMVAS